MALIEVKYDPSLKQSEIIARLDNSSPEEAGENYEKNPIEIQQTSLYGIQCPIIAINNIMVAVDDILNFELDDTKHEPSVSMCIYDRKRLIQYLDTPENDNELRVQILPPFEDVYKKIDLTFFITSFRMGNNNELYINANYKSPGLVSSRFKSFGEISLYKLCDSIASEIQLGFATNIEDMDDKRYVYCPYTSYKNSIEKEISHSGEQTIIYDWWIDVWNYFNLVNMYERYNAIDKDEDMMVWVSGNSDEVSESIKIEPLKTKAELTNLFGANETQLYVKSYRINNDPGINMKRGTDKVFSIYSMNDKSYKDIFISDGDVKKDIYNNFEYKGEVYGDYDYITNGIYREPFLQKIKNNIVEVDLTQPLLGLQRGGRCVFDCFYNNDLIDYTTHGFSEDGLMNDNPELATPIDWQNSKESDTFKLNKSISGQYLIIGNIYKYTEGTWTQTVILARPINQKPKILNTEE